MVEVAHQINEVSRQVGTKVLEAGEARVMTVSQVYDTGPDDLWDACTNAERIPRWFLPVSGELKVGGRYRLEGNAEGTIERCDPPKSFFATWEFAGDVSWIDVRILPEADGKARLELEHVAHVSDELWEQFGPGAVGMGWDMGLLGLAQYLSGAASVDPSTAAEWLKTDEARHFLQESSERWYEANLAAGTPEPVARASANRCAEAYTTPPEPLADA
jgi:uncharacterized protein YndB with AHSA1/START domain